MATKDWIVWFKTNFGAEIVAATAGTPFDLDMLTAIAVQETGSIWGRLINKGLTTERILELCVGDVLNAPRRSVKAFPNDRAQLVAWPGGDAMYAIARAALADMAEHITEYKPYVANPERFCHGYGLFQYDIQFFKTDPDYFLERRYIHFDQTLGKAISELTAQLASLGPKLGWKSDRKLSDADKAAVAIAYNTGGYNPNKGLQQGYYDKTSKKYYGEYFADYMALAKTVPLPSGPAPAPTPTPAPGPAPAPSPSPAPGGESMTVEVTSDPLNVRRTPAKAPGNVFAQLPNKHPVQAFETKDGFRHIKTVLNGDAIDGWAAAQFLKAVALPAPPPPPPSAPLGEPLVVEVGSDPLNVRRKPEKVAGNVFASLAKGHPVLAFEAQNGFRHIKTKLNGDTIDGWASAQFLRKP
ncbi:hypothetical protein OF829_10525 [Sphingomonas sp. LB-2]|uniref:SH3 domain-containing protein n=1 Tax=Sphingomonas caeni TaxID=2984949 RepID=UPI0022319E04|nr:hypothetical protein [Sphingomonas caeni]MCW3847677.1 hypothetical protein [Sphingomonas caeni]